MDAPAPRQTSSSPGAGLSRRQLWLALVCLVVVAATGLVAYKVLRSESLRRLQAQCHAAYQRGDWKGVVEHAERWRAEDPGAGLPCIYLAEAAQTMGDFDRAADYLAATPMGDFDLWLRAQTELTALLFGGANRPRRAAEVCLRILGQAPWHSEARQRLIFYYAITAQRVKMVEQARQAIEQGTDEPRNYVHLIGADYLVFTNGADINLRWIESDPDNETFHVARAMHLVMSGMVGNVDLEGRLPVPPSDDPDGEVGPRGRSLLQRRQYHEKVLADYLKKYPRNLELLAYFLKQAADNGEVERVAELLNRLPPEAEKDSRFWRHRGWLLASQQKYGEAEAAYRRALQGNPYDYLAQHGLAEVYRALQRDEEMEWMQQASLEGKALRKLILQLPNDREVTGEVLLKMAEYAARCGDKQASEALFRRINRARSPGSLPGALPGP